MSMQYPPAMEETYDDHDDLLDESIAPLKRNHACLSCKKRKVKCDGVRPHCSPCLRSHAHAIRAASRARVRAPLLTCEWADADSPSASPGEPFAPPASVFRKKPLKKLPIEKERERRQEDEKETLLARIAELEARLAGLTPPSSESSGPGSTLTNPSPDILPAPVPELDWELTGLFMVPTNWPRNLPAPYLLEHLVETFYNSVPQSPRILNRAKLMARIRLPANHPSFPHPALLHAVCATAAQYTAWVTSVPLEALESGVKAHQARGETLESFKDFALAQAESAHRAIQQTHQICQVGSPGSVFEIFQAELLVSDVWMSKGMYLKGWSNGGQASRYVKGLELANRTHPRRYKSGILPAPANAVDREERLASTWQTFISDCFSGLVRYWPLSMDDREMFCKLPAGAADVSRKDGNIPENPQDARDPRLYSEHPVHDTFVLLCKVAMLCSRTARFLRDWAQREVRAGDAMLGMELQIFKDIVRDVHIFQRSVPDVFKNVFRLQSGALTAELLALHIMPNICLLMLYESFADWERPSSGGVSAMTKAYEATMGILHLIPSNVDLGYIFTSDLAFNIHTLGRAVADFVQHALDRQSYDLASRHRADFNAIQNLLSRYGAKHPVGKFTQTFLENYINDIMDGREPSSDCSQRPPVPPASLDLFESSYFPTATGPSASMYFGLGAPAMDVELDNRSWSLFEEAALSS